MQDYLIQLYLLNVKKLIFQFVYKLNSSGWLTRPCLKAFCSHWLHSGSKIVVLTQSRLRHKILPQCAVPVNIHTPSMEGFFVLHPLPPGNSSLASVVLILLWESRWLTLQTSLHDCFHYASINVKPKGGGGGGWGPWAYVGHLTFQKNVWSKSPPWGPKIGSNQIKYPHLFHQFILKMSSKK